MADRRLLDDLEVKRLLGNLREHQNLYHQDPSIGVIEIWNQLYSS